MTKAKNILGFFFPAVMVAMTLLTLFRYGEIQDFKKRSFDHQFIVESQDIELVEKALRGATFQEVRREKIADDRYRLVVRCPPDNVGSIATLIQRLVKGEN